MTISLEEVWQPFFLFGSTYKSGFFLILFYYTEHDKIRHAVECQLKNQRIFSY